MADRRDHPGPRPSHSAVRHGHARSRGNGADSRKHHSAPDPVLPRSAVGRQSARGSSGAFSGVLTAAKAAEVIDEERGTWRAVGYSPARTLRLFVGRGRRRCCHPVRSARPRCGLSRLIGRNARTLSRAPAGCARRLSARSGGKGRTRRGRRLSAVPAASPPPLIARRRSPHGSPLPAGESPCARHRRGARGCAPASPCAGSAAAALRAGAGSPSRAW